MTNHKLKLAISAFAFTACMAIPAAAKDPEVTLTKCETSIGTIAITDGDQQGWTQFRLSSPRGVLGAMIEQSGCFTLHNAASGRPADFLMSAVAGAKEEVDQSMSMAKTALTEGLIRSGAAGQVLSRVPMGGALLGAFGGFGGKKKTIVAGLRVMSPATGQTLVSSTGEKRKSFLKVMSESDWSGNSAVGDYGSSADGKMLTGAFIEAYNGVVAQQNVLAAAKPAAPPPPAPTAPAAYTVASDTKLWAAPAAEGNPVRALRAATVLTPTGARQGLFVEVTDSYGTKGWVSVEDLR